MALINGNDYDHIDFTKNGVTTRHMLKDTLSRQMSGDLVKVQNEEPTSEGTKIWIKPSGDSEVQVPTYEEFEELSDKIDDADATIESLAVGAQPTVSVTDVDGHKRFSFGIPASNGIASITKTATDGVIDTYTIAMTDGTSTSFSVNNSDITPESMAEAIATALQDYARIDGYYPDLTAGNADQLNSTKFVENEEPYLYRPSGGTSDIGNRKYLDAIVGVSLPWNQMVRDEASENQTDFADILTVTDAVEDSAALKVKIEPQQDLHGYDHPWPAGGGANKWPVPNMSFSLYSTTLKREEYPEIYAAMEKLTRGANYRCGSTGTGENVLMAINLYYSDRTIAIRPTNMTGGEIPDLSDGTITLNNVQMQVGTATNVAKECREIRVIETTTSNPDYVPYENICPITGWTAAKVTRTGSNLASVEDIAKTASGTYNGISTQKAANGYTFNGVSTASGTKYFGGFKNYSERTFEVLANKTYVISYMQTGGFHLQGNILDKNNNQISASKSTWIIPGDRTDATTGRNYAVFVPTANGRIAFIAKASLTQETEYNGSISDIKLELASAPTAYEPYQGETYDITLPTEAGTVYGGSLSIAEDGSVVLTVDSELEIFDRELENEISSGLNYLNLVNGSVDVIGNYTRISFAGPSDRAKYNLISSTYARTMCNMLPHVFSYASESTHWYRNTVLYAYFPTSVVGSTKESVITYLKNLVTAGTPLTFWIPLATPITYTLTASEIRTLLGANNVWSDTGDVALTYTGTDEHLTLESGKKYLARINGTDSMLLGSAQEITAAKGTDNVFDLTKMFGTSVADYVYNQGAGYFRKWFSKTWYPYNTGELKHVEGLESHDLIGFNLLNLDGREPVTTSLVPFGGNRELAENQVWVGFAATNNMNSTNVTAWDVTFDSVSVTCRQAYGLGIPVRVLPNTEYYFGVSGSTERIDISEFTSDGEYIRYMALRSNKNLTTSPNCRWLMIVFRPSDNVNAKYTNLILSLVHNGSRNGEYEPYEKHSHLLDSTVVLRGIPKLINGKPGWDGDRYLPDGTVERRYGVVDLGTLMWQIGWSGFYSSTINIPTIGDAVNRIICSKYLTNDTQGACPDKHISIIWGGESYISNGYVFVKDSGYTDLAEFKSAMSGVMLVYELKTPAIEQALPYRNFQLVDDWGTEEFVTTGMIPVGHESRYPANLRDKLQHLPDAASSNGSYLITQTDGQMTLTPFPAPPTTAGKYALRATVTNGVATFTWEATT